MPANSLIASMARSYKSPGIYTCQPADCFLKAHLSRPLSTRVLLTGDSRYRMTVRLP